VEQKSRKWGSAYFHSNNLARHAHRRILFPVAQSACRLDVACRQKHEVAFSSSFAPGKCAAVENDVGEV